MEQSAPMDFNKLKGILNKSKAIMGAVDNGKYKKGNIDETKLRQEGLVENINPGHTPAPKPYVPPQQEKQIDYSSEAYKSKIQNSKMPDAVKQAMLANPIPQPDLSGVMGTGGGRTFTLEDLGYGKSNTPQINEQQVPQQQAAPQPPQQSYYPPQQAAPQMTREEIKSIVKECLAEMMVDTITENSVKNTLKALMTEGKIRVKKK